MKEIFSMVESERALPHNSAGHSNALVENPFEAPAETETDAE